MRKCLFGPFPLALLVLGDGLLYAQSDALFIDQAGDVSIAKNLKVTGNVTTNGNVGIGTDKPTVRLDVMGDAKVTGKLNAGDLTTTSLTTGSLATTGKSTLQGAVSIDGSNSSQALTVTGNAKINGGLTSMGDSQKNDEIVTRYEMSPRFHLSLTADQYSGSTQAILMTTLSELCGDQDGCEVRLGRPRWTADAQTATASLSFLFYFSPKDLRWRSSLNKEGVMKNGIVEPAADVGETCFFTDGAYSHGDDQSDKGTGMALLVWRGPDKEPTKNANRTCELTLID